MQKMHARARRRAKGLIFFSISSELKFRWDLPKKSLRSDKLMLSNLLKTNSPILMKKNVLWCPKHKWQGRKYQKYMGESKDLMSWKFKFYGKGHSPRDE